MLSVVVVSLTVHGVLRVGSAPTETLWRWVEQVSTDRMLFLLPNQQCQSTEGRWKFQYSQTKMAFHYVPVSAICVFAFINWLRVNSLSDKLRELPSSIALRVPSFASYMSLCLLCVVSFPCYLMSILNQLPVKQHSDDQYRCVCSQSQWRLQQLSANLTWALLVWNNHSTSTVVFAQTGTMQFNLRLVSGRVKLPAGHLFGSPQAFCRNALITLYTFVCYGWA